MFVLRLCVVYIFQAFFVARLRTWARATRSYRIIATTLPGCLLLLLFCCLFHAKFMTTNPTKPASQLIGYIETFLLLLLCVIVPRARNVDSHAVNFNIMIMSWHCQLLSELRAFEHHFRRRHCRRVDSFFALCCHFILILMLCYHSRSLFRFLFHIQWMDGWMWMWMWVCIQQQRSHKNI